MLDTDMSSPVPGSIGKPAAADEASVADGLAGTQRPEARLLATSDGLPAGPPSPTSANPVSCRSSPITADSGSPSMYCIA